MSAAWMHMMYQVCPTYDDLKYIIEKDPVILTKIFPSEKEYTLVIEEKSKVELTRFSDSCKLEKIISWADQILEKWEGCRKTSNNSWNFTTQTDAEKFRTLFYLSWDQSESR